MNKLMQRKQMLIDVIHQGRAGVPKAELTEKVAKMFKVKDPTTIVLFGLKSCFGGGKTSGFCLIYDNQQIMKKVEPRHRLIRAKLHDKKPEGTSKNRKEKKNRLKKFRGKEKAEKRKGGGK